MEIAATVGTSLADRVATAVVDGIWQQFHYVLDYHDNMTNLRDKFHDLRNSKARVLHLVDEATKTCLQEIESDVLMWISRADEAILKAEMILAEDDMANKTCCTGRLPNFKNRYKWSKRAKVEAPAISVLAEKGAKFDRVGYNVPLHHQVLPSDDYEAFGSRESTLNSIMETLQDLDTDLIGVWGLGGVGKTSLANEVRHRMNKKGVFKLVVMAGVHPKADVKIIQERVADWLQIKKEVESFDSIELRAALLHKRLLQEESVLVILDDVWDDIDLKKVGIPIGGDTKRCKVLVTTRDGSVVSKISAQKKKCFQLNVLTDDEAWKLFQKTVGFIPEDDYVLHGVATQIVKRCGGLPILVLPVAIALKNKSLPVWEDALQRLECGMQKDGDDIQALAYSAFELSCSHLSAHQMSLFLFCGLFKPHRIDIGDMVKYTTGLSLFKDCSTVKATRSRVLKLLGDLTSSCLLLKGDNHDYFTMHDIVHSFARGYQDHVFSPNDYSVVEEWPDLQTLEQLTHISVRYCQLPDLPTILECPKLKVFLLYGPLSTPGDMFFDAVEQLRVLDLSDVHLSSLPSSLQRLQNLQSLCLDRCIVEDVAVIGNLIQLKILSMIGAYIVHLPKEIGKLTRLQLLDLSSCRELKKISSGILSCLTHLEELYMRDSFTQWGLRDGQQINADLAELKKLKKLTALEIGVTDVTSLPDDLFSDKLERFFIVIGNCWDWWRNDGVSATLKVKLDANTRVFKKVNVLLKKADDLHLDNLDGVKEVNLSELNMEGFGHGLRNLQLQNFHEVQYLVNSVQRDSYITFPRLETLIIENAQHLEMICNGPLKGESLGNLKQIKISGCDAMSNVFPLSVARCLSKLEDIEVTYCAKMEGIFIMDEANVKDEKFHLTRLRKLTLEHLPRLNNILSPKCHDTSMEDVFASNSQDEDAVFNGSTLLMTFFNEKIISTNIEDLKLCSIKTRKIWNNEFPNSYSCIRNLAILEINGCNFIKDIFTISMINSLTQLKNLEIRNCRLLQEIIIAEKHGEVNKICLPKLESLVVKQLHSLVTVCSGDLIECPKLEELCIDDCPQLKTFITSSHQPASESLFDNKVLFPSLEDMLISNMDSLRMIWHEEVHEDSFTKLQILVVQKVRSLSKLFSSIMLRKIHTLKTLMLEDCDSLEEIFDLRGLISEKCKHPERITLLTDMMVWRLPNLKHVWHGDPLGILSFPNFRLVNFGDCSSLESLIPASIARQLPRLEEIELNDCSMEQIISKEERYQQDVDATFLFPSLKRIHIRYAEMLSSFYPGKHIIDWPSLQHVNIFECPRLEVFKSDPDNASKELQLGHQSSLSQPLFSFEQVVNKLQSISLTSQEMQMILKLELPDVFSSKLKVVYLYGFDDKSVELLINFLERFPNLEKLEVGFSDFVEFFSSGILSEEKEVRALSQIQHLRLENLDALEHIWNPHCKVNLIQKSLRSLEVWSCDSLVNLAPPSASLCNLTTLDVRGCESLVRLLTFSTMTSLAQLREITIRDCDKLTEIVAVSDEEIEGVTLICLYKLEILTLSELGSITSFCSQNNISLNFPLLVEIVVEDCPQMELFSQGYVSAPKLENVWLTSGKTSSRWKSDLNTTIRQLFTDKRIAEEEANTVGEEEEEDDLESSQP